MALKRARLLASDEVSELVRGDGNALGLVDRAYWAACVLPRLEAELTPEEHEHAMRAVDKWRQAQKRKSGAT